MSTSTTTQAQPTSRFKMPHTYVIIFCLVAFCALLTWIIPAGTFERAVSESGYTTVVPGSYTVVESTPVGLTGLFTAIVQGFNATADIIFFVFFAYGFVYVMMKNGAFDGLMGALIRKTQHFPVKIVFVVIMLVFGVLGSTMGMSEETYGMYPVFIGIAAALGYDAIVGASIVYIAVQAGFASATLNPFTVGVANAVSGIQMTTEMLYYRIACFVIFEAVGMWYVLRYASKIEKDPTKSLFYGTEWEKYGSDKSKEELMNVPLTTRHILCGITFLVVVILMVWGVIAQGWYITELSTLFLMAMVVVGIIGGFTPNEIAKSFVEACRGMVFGALIIGLSRSILIVLTNGQVIDTILFTLSSAMSGFSGIFSGMIQVVIQNIMNFFIPSGSGQAAAVMPIMAPLSDLLGISRQVAVLAETFGDGYSNMFIPTGVFTICGITGLPVNKWYRWIAPLFCIYFVLELVLISVAILIGL